MEKIVLRPDRVRTIPRSFGWIDQKLLFHPSHYLRHCDGSALALYLILVVVGDSKGISYYSDRRLAGLLNCSASCVRRSRQTLVEADLLAFRPPLYQVLSLPEAKEELCEGISADVFAKSLKEAGLL